MVMQIKFNNYFKKLNILNKYILLIIGIIVGIIIFAFIITINSEIIFDENNFQSKIKYSFYKNIYIPFLVFNSESKEPIIVNYEDLSENYNYYIGKKVEFTGFKFDEIGIYERNFYLSINNNGTIPNEGVIVLTNYNNSTQIKSNNYKVTVIGIVLPKTNFPFPPNRIFPTKPQTRPSSYFPTHFISKDPTLELLEIKSIDYNSYCCTKYVETSINVNYEDLFKNNEKYSGEVIEVIGYVDFNSSKNNGVVSGFIRNENPRYFFNVDFSYFNKYTDIKIQKNDYIKLYGFFVRTSSYELLKTQSGIVDIIAIQFEHNNVIYKVDEVRLLD